MACATSRRCSSRTDLERRRRAAGHLAPAGARMELGVLFAVLASQRSDDEEAVRAAYCAGLEGLLPDPPLCAAAS